jgi:hypothetical protein
MDAGVEIGRWQKPSFCESANDCVEVAKVAGGGRLVRNSSLGDAGPVVAFTESEWSAFIGSAKVGEFD